MEAGVAWSRSDPAKKGCQRAEMCGGGESLSCYMKMGVTSQSAAMASIQLTLVNRPKEVTASNNHMLVLTMNLRDLLTTASWMLAIAALWAVQRP